MQVSQSANSYTASSNGSSSLPNGNKQDQSFSKFVNDGNYASSNNALFKNMLSDPQLQDNYVLTADGAYEFIPDTTGTSYTDAVSILSFLIGEQNGDFDYEANGSVGLFTPNELATFRQLTGYNLVQANGMVTVVDDYGHGVPAADKARVMAAWETFDVAKGILEQTNPGAELTIADIQSAARIVADARGGDTSFWNDFFDMIDSLGSPDSVLDASLVADQKQNEGAAADQ